MRIRWYDWNPSYAWRVKDSAAIGNLDRIGNITAGSQCFDAGERIAEMAELLHSQSLPTRILAARIKSPAEAVRALLAGAHDITAAPQVLLDMVSDPQMDEVIGEFAHDWQKMNRL